jgi:hypothetical protein
MGSKGYEARKKKKMIEELVIMMICVGQDKIEWSLVKELGRAERGS